MIPTRATLQLPGVCLALASTCALSQEQSQQSAPEPSSYSQPEASVEPNSAAIRQAPSTDPSTDESAASDTEKYKKESRAEPAGAWPEFTPSDTYAQWIVAGLSVIGTIVSIWAVILVRGSLRLNTKATEEATRAADAGVRAAIAAEKAYLSDNRPWLKLTLNSVGPIDFKQRNVDAHVLIDNVGKSPALNVRLMVHGYIVRIIQPEKAHIARLVDSYVANAALNTEMSALIFVGEPVGTRSGGRIEELSTLPGNVRPEIGFFLVCTAVYRSSLSDSFFHTSVSYWVKSRDKWLRTDAAYTGDEQDRLGQPLMTWEAEPKVTSVS